jgi:hypothetical protein
MAKRKRKYNKRANCMGYALNRKQWMLPMGWDDFADGWNDESEIIDGLINQFNLIPVRRHEMVRGREYVAFRYEILDDEEDCKVDDFHFMKRHKTGHWTHKPGSLPVEGVSEKVVFSDVWVNSRYLYNSDIYLFEVA